MVAVAATLPAASANVAAPPGAGSFKRLVSRGVNFVTRVSKDSVAFSLVDGALELRVNGTFAKKVSVVRIRRTSAEIFDQDGWSAAVPHHMFARLEEKLRCLASSVPVPIFDVLAMAPEPTDRVVFRTTTATMWMPADSGELHISWLRPETVCKASGDIKQKEMTEVWPPPKLAAEGGPASAALAGYALDASAPTAKSLVRAAADWVTRQASNVLLVIDASSVEGQVLASEAWQVLSSADVRSAAVLVAPALTNLGGAASGYSTALAMRQVLAPASAPGAGCKDLSVAIVDQNVWRSSSLQARLLPLLTEQLFLDLEPALRVWPFPRNALQSAKAFIGEVLQAYSDSRPYVHALVGAGALEADVREGLEGSLEALEGGQVIGNEGQDRSIYPWAVFDQLEADCAGAKESSPAVGERRPRPCLLPIGRGGQALLKLVEARMGDLWNTCEDGTKRGGAAESLALLDLSDAKAVTFLRQRQQQEEQACLHVLALLPGAAAPRSAWNAVAEPLAVLAGAGEEESAELGVVIATAFGEDSAADPAGLDVRDALSLLEALGSAPLNAVAFQLQPRPRKGLVLPALQEGSQPPVLCPSCAELASGEVLAAYSLWPEGGGSDRLLSPSFLQPDLPATIARAGTAFRRAAKTPTPGTSHAWHLLLHEAAEAALYRRAAGDFGGRASAAFRWRGGKGPKADLWALAAELTGEAVDESGETVQEKKDEGTAAAADGAEEEGSHGYSDEEYEQDNEDSGSSHSRSESEAE